MLLQYERELTSIRFQTIEEKVKLRAAEMELVKTFEQEVDARASVLVDVKAKNIHLTNQQLMKEKAMLEQEVGSLVVLTTEVKQELRESKRGAELDLRIQEEALKHTAKLNKVAREADQKAQALETKCQSLSAEVERTLEKERAVHREEMQTLQQKNEELNRLVQLHRQDLKKMRQLATTIVQQRSDLETFFHEALRDVRAMRDSQEPQPRLHSAQPGGGRLGAISSQSSNNAPSQWLPDRIDNPTPSSAQSVQDQAPLPRLVGSASSYAGSERDPAWYRSLGSGRPCIIILRPRASCFHRFPSRTVRVSKRKQSEQSRPVAFVRLVRPWGGTSSRMSIPSTQDLWLRSTTKSATDMLPRWVQHRILHLRTYASCPLNDLTMEGLNFRTDLTWEEKEIVIQSLLFYLNAACNNPSRSRNQPPNQCSSKMRFVTKRRPRMSSGSAMLLSAIPTASCRQSNSGRYPFSHSDHQRTVAPMVAMLPPRPLLALVVKQQAGHFLSGA